MAPSCTRCRRPEGRVAAVAQAAAAGPAARAVAASVEAMMVAPDAVVRLAQGERRGAGARRVRVELPGGRRELAVQDPVASPVAAVARQTARAVRWRVAELAVAARRPQGVVVHPLGVAQATQAARGPAAEVPSRGEAVVAARRPQERVALRAAAAERARPASPAALARSAPAAVRRPGGS